MKAGKTLAAFAIGCTLGIATATAASAYLTYQFLDPATNSTVTGLISAPCSAETYSSEATDLAYTVEVLSTCDEVRVQAYYTNSGGSTGWSSLKKDPHYAYFTTSTGNVWYSRHYAGTP